VVRTGRRWLVTSCRAVSWLPACCCWLSLHARSTSAGTRLTVPPSTGHGIVSSPLQELCTSADVRLRLSEVVEQGHAQVFSCVSEGARYLRFASEQDHGVDMRSQHRQMTEAG
jgi:hypothetical protein